MHGTHNVKIRHYGLTLNLKVTVLIYSIYNISSSYVCYQEKNRCNYNK